MSICASLEAKMLTVLRALQGMEVPCVGLLECAAAGQVKEQDVTSLQLRVFGMSQPHEAYGMWQVSAELRLVVEQAESANGEVFYDAHEAVANWLERVMLADNCTALDTAEVNVDGLQVAQGGDADFDTSNGVWYAQWNLTLTGRLKEQTNEGDN